MGRRILITGSRDWTDKRVIQLAICIQLAGSDDIVTVVHGGATGADFLANHFAIQHPRLKPEEHKANWDAPCNADCYHKPRYRKNGDEYCPVAGNRRNQKMVDLGADICLAFPLGESRGTRDCMRRAEAAGIPVHNFGDEYLL